MGRGPDAEPPDRVVKLRVSRRPLRNLTLAVAGAALFDADFGGASAWSTRLPCSTSSARVCRRTRCGDVTTHAQWVGVSLLGEGEFPPGGRSDGVSALGGRGVRTACRLMRAGVSLDTLVLILRLALVSSLLDSLEALRGTGVRSSRHAAGRGWLEALGEPVREL